jgi:hypothetical protein
MDADVAKIASDFAVLKRDIVWTRFAGGGVLAVCFALFGWSSWVKIPAEVKSQIPDAVKSQVTAQLKPDVIAEVATNRKSIQGSKDEADRILAALRTAQGNTDALLKIDMQRFEFVSPGGRGSAGEAWVIAGNGIHERQLGPFGHEVLTTFWTTDSPVDLSSWGYIWTDKVGPNSVKLVAARRGGSNLRVRVYTIYR